MARMMTLNMFVGDAAPSGYMEMTYKVEYLYDLVLCDQNGTEKIIPMEMPGDSNDGDWIEEQIHCFMDHAMKQAGLSWSDWVYVDHYCVKRIYEL